MHAVTLRRRGRALGRALPLLCAAHCAAAPLLALTGSLLVVPEPIEAGLMLAGLGFAAVTVRCGIRAHGRWTPGVLAAAGGAVWAGSHWVLHGTTAAAEGPLHALAAAGGLLVFTALLLDGALRTRRRRCSCATCA